jgi:hypothetical protein
MIYKNRLISWNSLMGGIDSRVSESTVRRVVKQHFRRKWKALERPKLDADKAKVRYNFCTAWLPEVEELTEVQDFKVVLLSQLTSY